MEKELLFEAKHMKKTFGPTIALNDVDVCNSRQEHGVTKAYNKTETKSGRALPARYFYQEKRTWLI